MLSLGSVASAKHWPPAMGGACKSMGCAFGPEVPLSPHEPRKHVLEWGEARGWEGCQSRGVHAVRDRVLGMAHEWLCRLTPAHSQVSHQPDQLPPARLPH